MSLEIKRKIDELNDQLQNYVQPGIFILNSKAKEIFDKQHWSKHHEMAPVINPAVHTTFVFHYICLKRTEKQNTDIIT